MCHFFARRLDSKMWLLILDFRFLELKHRMEEGNTRGQETSGPTARKGSGIRGKQAEGAVVYCCVTAAQTMLVFSVAAESLRKRSQ